MNLRTILTLFVASFLSLSSIASAAEPVSKSLFGGVAIGGKDTVAYHEMGSGKATKGSKTYVVEWNGATWRFASEASRDKFAANPDQYVPEFNGHCANALSLGEGLVKTDGTVWQFFDNKLYLFYAQKGLDRWQDGDYMEYRTAAEKAWQALTR
jgi:YHS domain-containing protein